jgi:mRNA interferase MazF
MVKRPRPPQRDSVQLSIVRGEVWLVVLDPTVGSEIKKTRPCVVVSPPEIHDHLRTVLVAPMTTQSRPAPFRVPLHFDAKDGLILLDQLRALDKRRLLRRLGAIDRKTMRATLARLQDVFAE